MTKQQRSHAVLGLNPGFGGFNYHDPAAVLVLDGRVVAAAEEERFLRVKGAPGVFPGRAVRFCLDAAGIDLGQLDVIAVGYSPARWRDRLALELARAQLRSGALALAEQGRAGRSAPADVVVDAMTALTAEVAEILQRATVWRDDRGAATQLIGQLGIEAAQVPIRFVEHHLAHAASAFCPAGLDEATVVVVDGVGEVTAASVWHAYADDGIRLAREILLPNSLGYLYAAVTEYLGFRAWDGEGKTMALAPYGIRDPAVVEALESVATLGPAGYDVGDFVFGHLGSGLSLDLVRVVAALARVFGVPPRRPHQPITDRHRAIARAIQDYLEQAVLDLVDRAVHDTGSRDVCVAGGVFLNCKLNMVIRESGLVRHFYVQPVAKDSGLALGAAWHASSPEHGLLRADLPTLALGVTVPKERTKEALTTWGLPVDEPADLAEAVAELLCAGQIVFWFAGPAEFGPRALGRRSILADPRDSQMRARVNATVKSREDWRPFGPSILAEHAAEVLEAHGLGRSAPFMIEAYRVRPAWRPKIPAVVHSADGTTRPHIVDRDTDPLYYDVIQRFYQRTGCPMILNTSLNDRSEPIANELRDAVGFFYRSAADALAVDGYLVRKVR